MLYFGLEVVVKERGINCYSWSTFDPSMDYKDGILQKCKILQKSFNIFIDKVFTLLLPHSHANLRKCDHITEDFHMLRFFECPGSSVQLANICMQKQLSGPADGEQLHHKLSNNSSDCCSRAQPKQTLHTTEGGIAEY